MSVNSVLKTAREGNSRAKLDGRPDRQRGITSFLTWSFFLANFLTAVDAAEGSTRSAANDAADGHGHHASDPDLSALAARPVQQTEMESGSGNPSAPVAQSQAATPSPQGEPIKLGAPLPVGPIDGHTPISEGGATAANTSSGIQYVDNQGNSHGEPEIGSNINNTTNNYFLSDSHNNSTTTINEIYSTDSHDITNNVTIIADEVGHSVTPVIGIVENIVEVSENTAPVIGQTVSLIGEVVGDTVSTLLGDTVPTLVGDVVGGALGAVDHTLSDVIPNLAGVVVADLGDTGHALSDVLDTSSAPIVSPADSVVGTIIDVADHPLSTVISDLAGTVGADTGDTVQAPLVAFDTTVAPIISLVASTTDATLDTVDHTVSALVPDIAGSNATPSDNIVVSLVGSATDLISAPTTAADVPGAGSHAIEPILAALTGDVSSPDTSPNQPTALLSVQADLSLSTQPSDLVGGALHVADTTGSTSADPPSADSTHLNAGVVIGTTLDATLSAAGLSSAGSMTFGSTPVAPDAGSDPATAGYTQQSIVLHDLGSSESPATTATSTDTGGIGTIITSALGIGHSQTDVHATTTQDTPHVSILPLADDLHTHTHIGLFG